VDSPASGQGPMVGCCECGDEPSGFGATELVQGNVPLQVFTLQVWTAKTQRYIR
jgi:hypothetical protein